MCVCVCVCVCMCFLAIQDYNYVMQVAHTHMHVQWSRYTSYESHTHKRHSYNGSVYYHEADCATNTWKVGILISITNLR